MQYTEVRPSLFEDGKIFYPRKKDYLQGLRTVVKKSLHHAYFAMYYTGMTSNSTGDWVVLSDTSPDEYDTISLVEIF